MNKTKVIMIVAAFLLVCSVMATRITDTSISTLNISGRISCSNITGGTDLDFCSDADTGGGGITADQNNTLVTYIKYTNTSMKNYVDTLGIIDTDTWNSSAQMVLAVTDYLTGNNNTLVTYIKYTNTSMKTYVDSLNTSMKAYIDGSGIIDTDTWNSTADFEDSFYPLFSNPYQYYNNTINWNNLTNVPALGNSTVQIWGIVNNNSFYPYRDNPYGYYNITTLPGGSGDNESWNQSYATTLFADISVVDTDTDTWNTSSDIRYAMNTTNLYLGFGNLTNVPALGNTTVQIWSIANNLSFYPYKDNPYRYYNSTNSSSDIRYAMNTTNLYLGFSNLTNVPALGNSTVQIWSIANNLSFYPYKDNPYRYYNGTIGWNNLTGVPALGNTTQQMYASVNRTNITVGTVNFTDNSQVSITSNATCVIIKGKTIDLLIC